MVSRIYVEKKPGFDVEAKQLLAELHIAVPEGLSPDANLRLINQYDVEGIDEALFDQTVPTVFSEPQVDNATRTLPISDTQLATETAQELARQGKPTTGIVALPENVRVFAVEALPGQFDQRADSAAECVQLISQGERPVVAFAKIYVIEGECTDQALQEIKHYVINPVETREASLAPRETLKIAQPTPQPVEIVEGFTKLSTDELARFIADRGLAMDLADITMCRDYFAEEQRDPTITEIKMIDTYWSDHCRHTTFGTELTDVQIDDEVVKAAFDKYLELRHELGRDEKPVCLMDLGTIGARYLKSTGTLKNLDESEEINACTVKVKVDVNGHEEDWLFLFKNETHNHPTEIEPFGGAATCIGGCIRDPLSGRSYVYQAMRVTGAANPLAPMSETLAGKLPQRKLVTTAAAGYSSYGNQIGLATGQVNELYHPGYAAKRMEIGAVVGATPADHVRRETPAPGDVVILLGGRTGRDGIGGATGSSKAHNMESLEECGAEVQKGNAPVERKIQRLFRRGEATRLIKRCNDFGAGGVSVAIGELADGIRVDLNALPKKYDGLDGTELALSESQERMAVDVAAADVDEFIRYAHEENLEATPVATVTEEARVRMTWNGDAIVDISRDFLASNGASKEMNVRIPKQEAYQASWKGDTFEERLLDVVTDLNVCSNKGLSERFDSTIGASTVLMPFGGKTQLTPAQAMVAKLPVDGETTTCSGMAWGFNPYLSEKNQFSGAYLAVVESLSKLIATGFKREDAYFTFQEYFGSLRTVPERWGKPAASLLGALMAQLDFEVGSIGGKDSMSGSFEDLDVPPTLVSFATAVGKTDHIVSPEFKGAGHRVFCIEAHDYLPDGRPDAAGQREAMDIVQKLIDDGVVLSAFTLGFGGGAEALFKATLGNRIGFGLNHDVPTDVLFKNAYGAFLVELADEAPEPTGSDAVRINLTGTTTSGFTFSAGDEVIDLDKILDAYEGKLEPVYPYRSKAVGIETPQVETISFAEKLPLTYDGTIGAPRVIIPVFPGNNCEYDTARAFQRAGAKPDTFVINNLTPAAVAESTKELAKRIRESQILMIPGGFSGGDEPDGSAKFITAFFRAPEVTEAVRDLLWNRDGLILGICNGFQALIKLGLVPFGDIRPMDENCPTLTFNNIGRHQSSIVRTRIASTMSPWLSRCEVGDMHTVAISHGEGRFVASPELLEQLKAAGQIATQYIDANGNPSMDLAANPNGSVWAIEGITSPDGRVFGKMGHSERWSDGVYQNIPDRTFQPIIEGGVDYFSC